MASDGGGGVDPIDQGDVDEQVDGLKQFLRDNTQLARLGARLRDRLRLG